MLGLSPLSSFPISGEFWLALAMPSGNLGSLKTHSISIGLSIRV